ncbi:leishmanolysin family protein, putative, partial [Ichthyophthirius multifiliis]
RNLQMVNLPQQAQPIRITMDYILFGQNQNDITIRQKEQLKNTMNFIQVYFQQLLKVIPALGPNIYIIVKDVRIQIFLQNIEQMVREILIFIFGLPNIIIQILKFQLMLFIVKWILLQKELILVSLRQICIHYNTNLLILDLKFIQIIFCMKCCICQAKSLYKYWINPQTGDYYDNEINNYVKTVPIRGKQTIIMFTPNVLATARKYYGCPNLEGMQLENDGDINSM